MAIKTERPDVGDMMFNVFDRSVHPELFDAVEQHETVCPRSHFNARTWICSEGHVVHFRMGRFSITEVAASRKSALPEHKRRCSRRIVGQRDQTIEFEAGIRYHGCYQLENLEPDIFLTVHEELLADLPTATLSHRFQANASRFTPSPLSIVRTDLTKSALFIHTFHTFPDNCAIVKTQSLFEVL